MKTLRPISILYLFASLLLAQTDNDSNSVIWKMNQVREIGGFRISALNKLPSLSKSLGDTVLSFNGIDEALLVEGNPLENSEAFTIEVIFKPDSSNNPLNREQRFIHIRGKADDDRRILIELRLKSTQMWSLDTFIKSGKSKCTLLDSIRFNHLVGKWYHAALVYQHGTMKHYVDGVEELSGSVVYLPVQEGQVSIGARQDPRNWFKGSIKSIAFTKQALTPDQFHLHKK